MNKIQAKIVFLIWNCSIKNTSQYNHNMSDLLLNHNDMVSKHNFPNGQRININM